MSKKIEQAISHFVGTSATAVRFLANKAVAIAALAYAGDKYIKLSSDPANPLPFVEVYYAGLTAGAVTLLALAMRLVIFPEIASYAEKGQLKRDLAEGKWSPTLVHYWFGTALVFITVVLCISNIPK